MRIHFFFDNKRIYRKYFLPHAYNFFIAKLLTIVYK